MYNQNFIKYIHDVEMDGGQVTLTQSQDSTIAICQINGLDKYITVVECFEGDENFSLVNINGKAWEQVKRIMETYNRG